MQPTVSLSGSQRPPTHLLLEQLNGPFRSGRVGGQVDGLHVGWMLSTGSARGRVKLFIPVKPINHEVARQGFS